MQAQSKKSKLTAVLADAVAYIALTFSVGLAVSIAMAGAVLLLAHP